MNSRISLGICLIAFLVFSISCDNSTLPTDENSHYKAFWMHTNTGHAKDYYIQISLPRSYYKEETKKYPVLYLTDADYCFNMARDLTIVLDWPQREVIVVGIGYGSPERLSELRWPEYGDTPDEFGEHGWIQFLHFIEDQLIPIVESEYRINSHNRTLYGWSWGFLFTTNVIGRNPLLFHNYIVGGGWRDSLYVQELFDKWPELPVNIYFGTGEYDYNYQRMTDFTNILSGKSFHGLETIIGTYPELAHEIITMGVLLDRGMKWIYARKPIEPRLRVAMKKGGVEEVLNEYVRLLETNPDDFEFGPDHLISFAESLGEEGTNHAQKAILDYVETKYPKQQVTFQIRPKIMPKSDFVYITGNNPVLGDWDPKKVRLEQTELGEWSGAFTLRAGTDVEFKITRGSWETQAADSTGSELQNYRVSITSDTAITKVVENWLDTN